jgi:hypothetical protein
MKVKDLIKELLECDPEMEVVIEKSDQDTMNERYDRWYEEVENVFEEINKDTNENVLVLDS